ncbi:hypothetical protein KCP69_04400 [Salmonella enterica subsp. enterica]|nr:hypothetical protein KCP69_04400 [Salmonella enterica subsp. enterica]
MVLLPGIPGIHAQLSSQLHAGNHADVPNIRSEPDHRVAKRERKPLLYLDTHAARGRQLPANMLNVPESIILEGIARIWQQDDLPTNQPVY